MDQENSGSNTLLFLADFHYMHGFIGLDEYRERVKISFWLSSDDSNHTDPRGSTGENIESRKEEERKAINSDEYEITSKKSKGKTASADSSKNPIIEYSTSGLRNAWIFTISDPDSYPSVPHGHLRSPNLPWPKLNPYTGRAFLKKHKEGEKYRLKKKEMQKLWKDKGFRDFCRKHVLWYMEERTDFVFHVRHPLRFPKW